MYYELQQQTLHTRKATHSLLRKVQIPAATCLRYKQSNLYHDAIAVS